MSTSRRILKNIFSLSIAEVANKGIVFITTAYLARVIGLDKFGIISFANSVLLYFLLFSNLGFNIVGIRETARKPDQVNNYASQITTYRLILSFISCFAMMIFALIIDKPIEVKILIIISTINLVSNAFLMDWVYQGAEKMGVLALRQVITSGINLIGYLLFVHSPSDVILALVITVTSTFLNSLWMFILFNKMYGKIRLFIDTKMMKELLSSSIPIMFSNFFITIYNSMNIVMLGFMKSDSETGIYSAAFKFVGLTIAPSAIINIAFFPLVARAESEEQKARALKVYSKGLYFVGSILTFIICIFASYFIKFTYGSDYLSSIPVLQVLMLTVLIMYMNTAYYPPLVAWKKEKIVMYAIGAGAVINIILNLILIPLYGAMGAAWSTVFSELGVFFGLIFLIKKEINSTYIFNLFYAIIIAGLASSSGYLFNRYLHIHEIVASIIAFITFCILLFVFKITNVTEIKGYLSK